MDKLICPIYTGMSLRTQTAIIENSQVYPGIHRDEPIFQHNSHYGTGFAPVCTGMNRLDLLVIYLENSLPRTHGDKPMKKAIRFMEGASAPYVRG